MNNLPTYVVAIHLPDGLTGFLGHPIYREGMHLPLAPIALELVNLPSEAARRNTAADAVLLGIDSGWHPDLVHVVELPQEQGAIDVAAG